MFISTFISTFFKQVDKFINEYSIGQIILAGDYNDILSKTETKKLYQSKKFDKPVHNLKSMIKSHKLIDIFFTICQIFYNDQLFYPSLLV
jgi:hypothetical protein